MTDHLALRFDWNDVAHATVTAVLGLHARTMDDGSACWDAIALCLAETAILLTVDADTDQIIVSHQAIPSGDAWQRIPSFDFARAEPLGWCWIGTNSQGYQDSFILAFGDVVPDTLQPRCLFLAEGAALTCFDLVQRPA